MCFFVCLFGFFFVFVFLFSFFCMMNCIYHFWLFFKIRCSCNSGSVIDSSDPKRCVDINECLTVRMCRILTQNKQNKNNENMVKKDGVVNNCDKAWSSLPFGFFLFLFLLLFTSVKNSLGNASQPRKFYQLNFVLSLVYLTGWEFCPHKVEKMKSTSAIRTSLLG